MSRRAEELEPGCHATLTAAETWIVVLHYGGADYTRRCLSSLSRLTVKPGGILLTDNQSPDNSGSAVVFDYPDVHFQQLSQNLGFAGGANAGIRYCIERGARWIWLLNNDTEPEPDSLEHLLKFAGGSTDAGALGATVYTPTGDTVLESGRGTIDFRRAKTFERGSIDKEAQTYDCQWLSGCNLLLRAEAFQQLSGFDEDYFLYFEDVDLCWRMNNAGWRCLLVPAARVKHIGAVSTGEALSVWRSYYHTRNRFLFFLRHSKGAGAIMSMAAISAHLLRHSLVLPLRGRKGRRQLRAELLGFRDFLLGKFGKADCLDF